MWKPQRQCVFSGVTGKKALALGKGSDCQASRAQAREAAEAILRAASNEA